MTTARTAQEEALGEVQRAYAKRRELTARLAEQNRYIGHVVRQAREVDISWVEIARVGEVTDAAVIFASRRGL